MSGPAEQFLVAVLAAAAAGPVAAQGFKPSKPVELIVHGGPGSGVDVTARFVNGVLDRDKLLPVRSAVDFIAQRRQIFKEAGIQTYR